MIIGVPKEIKEEENRVAITPTGVAAFVAHGHQVVVQKSAGAGSGILDRSYEGAGATLADSAAEVWRRADLIMKVKEPLASEFQYLRDGLILFTYLHLAANELVTNALLEEKVTAVAYETIQLDDSSLPLLRPMSEVAGKMAVQVGATSLEKAHGGKGILLGGVPGVRRGKVAIIGGGVVGTCAAKVAVGMGAEVTILDVNLNQLAYLDDVFLGRVATMSSDSENIAKAVREADLVVGGVLIPGAKAPKLVSEELIAEM